MLVEPQGAQSRVARHRVSQGLDVPVLFELPLIEYVDWFQQRPNEHAVDIPVSLAVGELSEVHVPQVTPQERFSEQIEEHIVDVPVQQGILQERNSERIPELIVERGIPQEQISERIPELFVARDIPQERTTERILELIVDDTGPCIPQERVSERIQKQNDVAPDLQSIPQERISERIQEPIIDAKRGTSSSAAVQLDTAECAVDGVFRTFPRSGVELAGSVPWHGVQAHACMQVLPQGLLPTR